MTADQKPGTEAFYVAHEIQQSGAWGRVHEYECASRAQVEALVADIKARHPRDVARFPVRRVVHSRPLPWLKV